MSKKKELEKQNYEIDLSKKHFISSNDNINIFSMNDYQTDAKTLLHQLINTFEIGKTANKIINPELDYAVKFTPELLKKMEMHDVRFLKDKITGDLLPDLYDYTEKGLGGKIRLEIKGKVTNQDMINFHNAIHNMFEQQQYQLLMEEIQELHIIAKRIERGQDNDRFAKVNAGRKHLIDALNYKGNLDEKRKLILDSLSMLREGRELIEKTLIDKLNSLEEIPESKLKLIWTCFKKTNYYETQTTRYNDIQEYFQYYCMSIEPMAYAYTYLKQPHLICSLLDDSKKVFEHQNLYRISKIEPMLSYNNFEEMWYRSPEYYKTKLLNTYEQDYHNDNILIRFKGNELLEAMDNENKQ